MSLWATFRDQPDSWTPRPGAYAQIRTTQAQARPPMDGLKVAIRDTEGARHTDNTPTQSRMAARRAPSAAVPTATDPMSKLRTTTINQRSGNW